MALEPKRSTEAVNSEADAFAALLDNGYIRFYDGTKPANANTAIGAQVLLAELRWNATAFGAAVAGLITANAITSDSSANNNGTATWARFLKSNGTSVEMDCTVGTGTNDIVLNTVSIVAGAVVALSAFTYQANAG